MDASGNSLDRQTKSAEIPPRGPFHRHPFLFRIPVEVKLGILFGVSVLLLMYRDVSVFCSVYFLMLILVPWTGLSVSTMFRKLRPMMVSGSVIFISHALVTGGDPVTVFHRTVPMISHQGIVLGFFYGMTIILLSTLSLFVTATTSPDRMSRGIANLLRPLTRLGLPVSEFGQLLAKTIVYVPVIMSQVESTCRSYKFQVGRGSLGTRLESGIRSLVDLFAQCLQDAVRVLHSKKDGSDPDPLQTPTDAEKISPNP